MTKVTLVIAIPDELVEQVKSVARTEALEKFFINKETFRVYFSADKRGANGSPEGGYHNWR
ncbi:MAG: hypothetical protein KKC71_09980 [Chloroflexi bacterium]|nr:hypothetical protein [Chloroflexota bacterium]